MQVPPPKPPSLERLTGHGNEVVVKYARLAMVALTTLSLDVLPDNPATDLPATELLDKLREHHLQLLDDSPSRASLRDIVRNLVFATRLADLTEFSAVQRLGDATVVDQQVEEDVGDDVQGVTCAPAGAPTAQAEVGEGVGHDVQGVERAPAGAPSTAHAEESCQQAELKATRHVVGSFKRLGAGSFATVFASEHYGAGVIKQVHDPAQAMTILQEHRDLELIAAICKTREHLFHVPQPYGGYNSYRSLVKAMNIPQHLDLGLSPHALYVMQRMWPVPLNFGFAIREKYFPEAEKQKPLPAFLARLYLGRAKSQASRRFFSCENFPLTADRIEGLGLPAARIAAGMGQLLSCINFEVGRDGRDIEFVLCSNPNNPFSTEPWYGCIDFNQLRAHSDDVDVIVESITINDPYYPRPTSPYWQDFCCAYLAGAFQVSSPAGNLATAVINKLMERWGGK
eukprot:jgi/Chlat1/3032/Chrsp206S00234